MDYTDAIFWYAMWPVVIFIAYKFIMLNLRHYTEMERLEILEKRFGDECSHTDALLEEKKK